MVEKELQQAVKSVSGLPAYKLGALVVDGFLLTGQVSSWRG
jgi:uncharacterized protein with ACT and thioredoxin-like domain